MKTFTIDCFQSALEYFQYIRAYRHQFPEAWEEMKPDVESFRDEYGRDMNGWDMDTRARFTDSMVHNAARWYIAAEEIA